MEETLTLHPTRRQQPEPHAREHESLDKNPTAVDT